MSKTTVDRAWCEANLPGNLPMEPPTDDETVTPATVRGLLALIVCHNARANAYIAFLAQTKNEEGKVVAAATPTYAETLAWVEERATARASTRKKKA